MSDGRVIALPPGEDLNHFILKTADKLDAVIVSNNIYAEHYEEFPWIEERRIAIALVNDKIHLLEKMRRAG
jgi:hypothetical protein